MLPIKFLKQAFMVVSIAIALVGTVVLVPFILPITFPIVFLALVVLLVLVLVALLLLLLIVLLLLVKSLPRLLREDLAGTSQEVTSANATSTSTSTATQTQTQSQRQIQARGGKSPIPKVRNGSVSSSINSARVDTFRSNRLDSCHEDDHDPFHPDANVNEPDTNPTASQATYATFGIDSPRKHKPYYA